MSTKYQIPVLSNEVVFQDFICDLYNYQYPGKSFQRFGNKGHKQNGIDIISVSARIAIQCKKKELTRKKLIDELKKDFETDIRSFAQIENVDDLIFVSTFDDSPLLIEHLQQLKKMVGLKANVTYLGWQSITDMAQNHLELLKKYFPDLIKIEKNKFLTPVPFFEQALLLGRNDLFKQLDNELLKYDLTVLQGIGGTGKTVALSCYVRNSAPAYDSIVWIECQADSLKDDIITQLSSVWQELKDNRNIDIKWEELRKRMANTKGKHLMVIDGIDFLENEIYDILEDISAPGWKVIVSSRVKMPDYAEIVIEGLPLTDARQLFKRYYKKDIDAELLDKILVLLETHPLVVELVAKAANANQQLSLIQLYTSLNEENIKSPDLQRLINIGMHSRKYVSNRYQHIFKYLSVCFELNHLTGIEQIQLGYFSILPSSHPINLTFFLEITSQEGSIDVTESLNSLELKGWINYRNGDYFIHPLIQVIAQGKLAIYDQIMGPVILTCTQNLYLVNRIGPWSLKEYILTANNILNITGINVDTIFLCTFYATAITGMGNYNKAIKSLENCVTFIEKEEVTHRPLCEGIYNNLALAYKFAGLHNKAKEYYEKAMLFHSPDDDDNEDMSMHSVDNYATLLERQGHYAEAIKLTLKAIKGFKEKEDFESLGLAYINLSNTLSLMQKHRHAFKYWKKGFDILSTHFDEDHSRIADAYETLGLLYINTDRFYKAKNAYTKALLIRGNNFQPSVLTTIHANIAFVQIELYQLDAAKEHLDKAQHLLGTVQGISQDDLAQLMRTFGNYYIKKLKWKEAKKCWQQSLEIFKNLFPDGHPDIETLEHNLKILQSDIAERYFISVSLHQILPVLKESISINQKIFNKIVDEYGIIKGKTNTKNTLEDCVHDCILFYFTKSCKSFIGISGLLNKNAAEDILTLLYAVYRNYLSISILRSKDQLSALFTDIPVCIEAGMIKYAVNKFGIQDTTSFLDPANKEQDIYVKLSFLVTESPYEEDRLLHKYLELCLSKQAYGNFTTIDSYNNDERFSYNNNDTLLSRIAPFLTLYFQLIILKEMMIYLSDEKLINESKETLQESVSLVSAVVEILNYSHEEQKLIKDRLRKVLEN